MAKFEDSSYFPSKVTAFFCKVPTTIFVNPSQCPSKSVKMENYTIPSKINIFEKNLHRKCISTISINLCQNNWKIPDFSRKNGIWGNFGTDFPIGKHYFKLICELQRTLSKNIEGFIDFPSLDMKGLLWLMIFN